MKVHSIGNGAEKQLRQACADLEQRLRAGECCRAETYFARFPLLASHDEMALDLIYAEFDVREQLQQRPTPEEFFARFPHWKERLERQFAVHELLRDGTRSENVPVPSSAHADWLGSYELLEELSRGGRGIVYKAWQHGLERLVAVKVLRPELAALLPLRQHFVREARVMATLRHPHLMPVHDVGESQGVIFFCMDFMPAGSLADWLAANGGPLPPARVVALVETVAQAMYHAHGLGVIHRDLKPSNILLDPRAEPVVSDFGLALWPVREEYEDGAEPVGTPAYMAPEQIMAPETPLTPAVDTWALGVILYELLTGRRPFTSKIRSELHEEICQARPLSLRRLVPSLDTQLEMICLRCLARLPTQRYASAQELADDLRRYRLG